jgi:hypothetical protein
MNESNIIFIQDIRNRIMVSPGSAFGIDFDQSNSKQDQI